MNEEITLPGIWRTEGYLTGKRLLQYLQTKWIQWPLYNLNQFIEQNFPELELLRHSWRESPKDNSPSETAYCWEIHFRKDNRISAFYFTENAQPSETLLCSVSNLLFSADIRIIETDSRSVSEEGCVA
jgi:hypothetical protein